MPSRTESACYDIGYGEINSVSSKHGGKAAAAGSAAAAGGKGFKKGLGIGAGKSQGTQSGNITSATTGNPNAAAKNHISHKVSRNSNLSNHGSTITVSFKIHASSSRLTDDVLI